MKRIGFFLLLGWVMQISFEARAAAQPSAAQPSTRKTNDSAALVAPTIIARTPSSRTWARIASQTNAAGVVSLVTNSTYIEMATGLCFSNAAGKLVDAKEEIETDNVAGGASAKQAGHKVHFAGNANTAGGAVHLVAPDGKVFDSRVYGLSYWDSVSGSNVLLAPLQDCGGTLVGNNRVVYTNAFKGLKADIEYLFTKAGLEQDIVLKEQPPTPDSLGLNPQTTRLQVLTEFFNPAAPRIKSGVVEGVEDHRQLDFGGMIIGVGRAFLAQGQDQPNVPGLGNVQKQWRKLAGRDFLIEEISYSKVAKSLQTLPAHASAGAISPAIEHLAALEPLLPSEAAGQGPSLPMRTAQAMPSQPGLVVDYIIWNNDSPPENIFYGGTTYYISGSVNACSPTYFMGGAVIKFTNATSGSYVFFANQCDTPFYFNGPPGQPTVFTVATDQSVGEAIDGASGYPTPNLWPFLMENSCMATEALVAYARFSYGGYAIWNWQCALNLVFQDCEFNHCGSDATPAAIFVLPSYNVQLTNDLFTGCRAVVAGYAGITVQAQNITADGITNFVDPGYAPTCSGTITDSILCNCDNGGCTETCTDDTDYVPWQTSYLGDHYLPSDSPDRNAGSTTADQVGLYWYTTQTSQVPQGASQVDLGYHYRATDSNGNPLDVHGDGGNWSAPSITTQPASQTVSPGSPVTFSVAATGSAPLTYQWRLNSNNISGATASNYSITSVQATDAGTYAVVVGNGFGSAGSATATLTVNSPPSITGQPSAETVVLGAPASFSVTATGTGTLTYQWRLNGNNISGATSSSFSITSAQATDAGTYSVVVTNAYGSATSDGAVLTVNLPPTITTQPASQTVDPGAGASFSVSATGTAPLSYQWRFNGNNISGATSSSFAITSVQTTDAGTYAVVVSNAVGTATSDGATLTVNPPVTITSQPASQTVDAGTTATFSVTATGVATLSYQWTFNGNNIYGANDSTYSVAGAQTTDAGTYAVVVANDFGSLASDGATLTVNPPIQFGISFANQYVNQANVPLSLDIQSGTPLYYAVLLDSTSFSTASWTAYTSSNITKNLGGTEGWHTVWVGLRDLLSGGVPTWSSVRLELLLTPPAITITAPGPGNNTVDQPILQLQGYAPEEFVQRDL